MSIPKIIHQIWIGPNKPPDFMHTVKDNHPDYEYILWDEEQIERQLFPLINQHLYDLYDFEQSNVWNGRSNLLRLEILKKYGGIYIDADCKCLRPLEGSFLDSELFAAYANENYRDDLLANGVIGSTKNNDFINIYINELNKHNELKQPSNIFSGPRLFTDLIKKYNYDICKLPSYYFYPCFYNGVKYNGDFIPFFDHVWGTTLHLYGSI